MIPTVSSNYPFKYRWQLAYVVDSLEPPDDDPPEGWQATMAWIVKAVISGGVNPGSDRPLYGDFTVFWTRELSRKRTKGEPNFPDGPATDGGT